MRACARQPRASTTARLAASKDRTTAIWSHRPSVLDVAVLHMVGLDARAGNRETVVCRHREGFRRFWDLAIAGARARRTSFSIERIRALVCHMASPNPLWGCAAHPRRAHQARDRDLAAHGRPASAAPRASAVAVVARVPGEPSWCSGLDGFLRRTDRDIPRALRSAHSGSRVPPHPSISPSPTRRRLRGQRSKLPRRSHGKRLRGVSSEIATRPTA